MPSEKQYLERKENIASILEHLRQYGPKSRRELSDQLQLSWGCISELAALLLAEHVLIEEELRVPKTKGRVPSVLKLNPNVLFLGIDININGLNACVCNLLGEKLEHAAGDLQLDNNEALVNSVCAFTEQLLQKYESIVGVGFAMQGIYHAEQHTWTLPVNGLRIDFDRDFAGKLSRPFVVEHDPNCILYGCFAKNEGSRMIVRLDKGIGAAVYKDGVFLKNELLEIGYMVVGPNGERLHDLVSSTAVQREFGIFTPSAAEEKHRLYFESVGKYLGITLGNICNLLHLDKIYICGDMIAYSALFYDAMLTYYGKTVIPSQAAAIRTVEITDAAYGAAKMAIDQFQY